MIEFFGNCSNLKMFRFGDFFWKFWNSEKKCKKNNVSFFWDKIRIFCSHFGISFFVLFFTDQTSELKFQKGSKSKKSPKKGSKDVPSHFVSFYFYVMLSKSWHFFDEKFFLKIDFFDENFFSKNWLFWRKIFSKNWHFFDEKCFLKIDFFDENFFSKNWIFWRKNFSKNWHFFDETFFLKIDFFDEIFCSKN